MQPRIRTRFPLLLVLSTLAFFACAPSSRADDAPAAPPAPAQAPAPAAVVPPVAPAARREETDGQAQPAARATIGDRVRAMIGSGDLVQLRADLRAAQVDTTQLRADLTTARATITTLTAERDQLAAQVREVETALGTATNTARAAAVEIAQSTGIPPASLPAPVQSAEDTDAVTAANYMEKLNAIKDPMAAAAFRAKHVAVRNAAYEAGRQARV